MKTTGMRKHRIMSGRTLEDLAKETGIEKGVLKMIEDDINYAKIREKLLISSVLNCTHYDLE